ncbi:J domain-containing protein [Kovacikia minuta CCNUW1]|uniref:J domain-containing protein n=1 Tax=Kovacikia minuta TaxID=2931930 RepID=UPI001CCAC270|nr:J domain-containing protein [Kovacikia minuta]UBF26727.1 J domain-containing protein [Kovacikia minuta CCNUW1]
MNLADCYRLLRLKSGASFDEIKAAYRRLARQYHPDVNPGDQQAKERFIAVTEAYKFLLAAGAGSGNGQTEQTKTTRNSSVEAPPPSAAPKATGVKITRKSDPIQFNPDLSPVEQQLKSSSYQQLQQLLREHRFPRAIALIEGLARRIPQDPEVVQWQAIVYQRWGRHLIQERQLDKARIYLKKALRTDPHNRSLWAEVEKDFRYMEQLF